MWLKEHIPFEVSAAIHNYSDYNETYIFYLFISLWSHYSHIIVPWFTVPWFLIHQYLLRSYDEVTVIVCFSSPRMYIQMVQQLTDVLTYVISTSTMQTGVAQLNTSRHRSIVVQQDDPW